MSISNLPLKVASFIVLSTYVTFLVLYPLTTLGVTGAAVILLSVAIVLAHLISFISNL